MSSSSFAKRFDPVLAAFIQRPDYPIADSRRALESLCVEEAMRGFHAVRPDAEWSTRIEQLVRDYFRNELTQKVLDTHQEGAQAWASFASYAVGWLIAEQVTGQLVGEDVDAAFALLPGYMWFHEAKICGRTGAY